MKFRLFKHKEDTRQKRKEIQRVQSILVSREASPPSPDKKGVDYTSHWTKWNTPSSKDDEGEAEEEGGEGEEDVESFSIHVFPLGHHQRRLEVWEV
jgi:hypothetical protein